MNGSATSKWTQAITPWNGPTLALALYKATKVRVKRSLLVGVLVPLAFLGSCVALIPPAFRLADPLTHRPVETHSAEPFPVLVVHGDQARVLMLDDLRSIPPLPAGATYLVPQGKEAAFQRDLYAQAPPGVDSSWVLRVKPSAADRQRIELYLMGDGYWGGAYDATHSTVTPRYRKTTGPGFAFIAGSVALATNMGLWAIGAASFRVLRQKRSSASPRATDGTPASDASRS